jgi:hypothetical protein
MSASRPVDSDSDDEGHAPPAPSSGAKRFAVAGDDDVQYARVTTSSELRAPGKRVDKATLLKKAEKREAALHRLQGTSKGIVRGCLLLLLRARRRERADGGADVVQEIAQDHAFDAALHRAAGEKVRDNPELLRKSLHKDLKKKEKSRQQWCACVCSLPAARCV